MNMKILLLAFVPFLTSHSQPQPEFFLRVTTADLKPEGGDGKVYINLRCVKSVDKGLYKPTVITFTDDYRLECDEPMAVVARAINQLSGRDDPVWLVKLSALNKSVLYANFRNVSMFYKNESGTVVWFTNNKFVNCADSVPDVVGRIKSPR